MAAVQEQGVLPSPLHICLLMVLVCCWCVSHRGNKRAISDALWRLHVETSKPDPNLRADMAYGMFDTRGRVR